MESPNDPALRSFVPVTGDSPFPIQNLPYGIFRRGGIRPAAVGVAIGDHILDMAAVEAAGLLKDVIPPGQTIFNRPALNAFMALGQSTWRGVRAALSRLLRVDVATLRDDQSLRDHALLRQSEAELLLPVEIGNYTDFYSSREHATNVGTMLRGADNALQPNWLHLPVAYHGRASSVVVSGTDLHRPLGHGGLRPTG